MANVQAMREVLASWKVQVDTKQLDILNKKLDLASMKLRGAGSIKSRRAAQLGLLGVQAQRGNFALRQMKQQLAIQERSARIEQQQLRDRQRSYRRMAGRASSVFWMSSLGAGALGGAGWKAAQKASAAEESRNLLDQTFGVNAPGMVSWASRTGKTMQRSKYQMEDYAGRFGAFLTPMVGNDPNADVADMSQKASQLVIDLASFFNTSEDEARQRVYSGLAGETEAVRKYGVDLSDAALEAMNRANGSNVAYNQLTASEKTMLRFQKLMKDTTLAQGDAVRTADSFANTMRRVDSQFQEMTVEVGKGLMPVIKNFSTQMANYVLPAVQTIGVESNALTHAFEELVIAAGAAAVAFAAFKMQGGAGMGANLITAGGIAAASVLYDDVRHAQEGKDSGLGRFARDVFGNPGDLQQTGVDRMQNSVFGGLYRLGAGVHDVANMARDTSKWGQWSNLNEARKLTAGVDLNTTRVDNSRKADLMAMAARGDAAGFGENFAGTSAEAQAAWNEARRKQLANGTLVATAQDVADGLAAAPGYGPMTPQQLLGTLPQSVQNSVTVNVSNPNATGPEIAQAVAQAMEEFNAQQLRRAAALGGEEIPETE